MYASVKNVASFSYLKLKIYRKLDAREHSVVLIGSN